MRDIHAATNANIRVRGRGSGYLEIEGQREAPVSLMVVIITNELDFNGPEGNAYTVMKKLQYKELLRETALRILKTSVKKIQRPDGTWRVS